MTTLWRLCGQRVALGSDAHPVARAEGCDGERDARSLRLPKTLGTIPGERP